jgi:hypothetical protein
MPPQKPRINPVPIPPGPPPPARHISELYFKIKDTVHKYYHDQDERVREVITAIAYYKYSTDKKERIDEAIERTRDSNHEDVVCAHEKITPDQFSEYITNAQRDFKEVTQSLVVRAATEGVSGRVVRGTAESEEKWNRAFEELRDTTNEIRRAITKEQQQGTAPWQSFVKNARQKVGELLQHITFELIAAIVVPTILVLIISIGVVSLWDKPARIFFDLALKDDHFRQYVEQAIGKKGLEERNIQLEDQNKDEHITNDNLQQSLKTCEAADMKCEIQLRDKIKINGNKKR